MEIDRYGETGGDTPLLAPESVLQLDSPLMAMPPEIRNRIYSYMIRDRANRSTGVLSQANSSKPLGTDRGLMQTCRLLRYEFRPLYLASLWPRVRLTEALDYLKGVYGGKDKDFMSLQLKVSLSVDPRHNSRRCSVNVDLAPMLQFCMQHNIQLTVEPIRPMRSGLYKLYTVVHHVFEKNKEAWQNAVCGDLARLVIVWKSQHSRPKYHMIFKETTPQAWLRDPLWTKDSTTGIRKPNAGKKQYIHMLGLAFTPRRKFKG